MKIFIGYAWGIWEWRTCAPNTRVELTTCSQDTLDNSVPYVNMLKGGGLKQIMEDGFSRGIPKWLPIDVVVTDRLSGAHSTSKTCIRHQYKGPVPPGSLSQVGNGTYLFTPAFCLLQIASIATKRWGKEVERKFLVVIVAQLGCEICGRYSISQDGNGSIDRVFPLTSVGEIAQLALGHAGAYGSSLLRQAIPWIIDNLRSPRETQLFLLLCLPASLGGYDLPTPLSNYGIDVSWVAEGFFATWETCSVDLFWPQFKLIVEYDSDMWHADQGVDKVEADKHRAAALEDLGYTVISVKREDVTKPKLMQAKAQEIADAMKRQLPKETDEFKAANKLLRNYLLYHGLWV